MNGRTFFKNSRKRGRSQHQLEIYDRSYLLVSYDRPLIPLEGCTCPLAADSYQAIDEIPPCCGKKVRG